MRIKQILILLFAVSLFFVTESFAYTINDPVGIAYPTPGYDRIGNKKFELFGMDVTDSAGKLTFDIYTNYNKAGESGTNPNVWYTFPGDLFFDFNGDGDYDHGVAFTNKEGLTAGGFYSIDSAKKSNDYAKPGYIYFEDQYVTIDDGDLLGMADLFTQEDITGTAPNYRWRLILDKDYFTSGNIGVHYGVATCSNDYMDGSFNVSPEPATMALFGLGLAGLALRRKRSKV